MLDKKKPSGPWKSPIKKDLRIGNVIEIKDGKGNVEGKARLVKRKPSRYIQDGLPKVEFVKRNEKQNDTLYIYGAERWQVSWTEHPYYRVGDENCRHVHYFVTKSTDYPSKVDLNVLGQNLLGERGLSPAGCYIFLEEQGVLIPYQEDEEGNQINVDVYSKESVTYFKKFKKRFDGEIVVYTNNPSEVRDRFEINNLPFRVYDFLHADKSFAAAVKEFMDNHDVQDYAILSGVSEVQGSRVIQSSPEVGLRPRKKN